MLRKPEPKIRNYRWQGRLYDVYEWGTRQILKETNQSLKKRTGRIREVERSILYTGHGKENHIQKGAVK